MSGSGVGRAMRALGVGALAGLCALPLCAQTDACEALHSPALRQRFALVAAACPVASAVQTDRAAPAPARPRPDAESAHLLLFSRPGLVSSTGAEGPAVNAAPAAPLTSPTNSRTNAAKAARRPASPPPAAASRPESRAVQLAPHIDDTAQRHDIDPLLLHAIAHVESRHNPQARSHAGALGVMQVMPATAQRFGVAHALALHDVRTNLDVSATYLKTLQRRFQGQLPLVLAAYHAGEGAVERSGRRVPENGQTPGYVAQVLAQYRALTQAARSAAPAPH